MTFRLVALLLLVPIIVDMIRRPTFRRLAFRNISRRRGEAALVIVGSLLGTAIITASFVVGDTIEGSLRDGARTELGPVDETVRFTDGSQIAAAEKAITVPPLPGVDGVLPVTAAGVVAASTTADRKAQPVAAMLEVDLDRGRGFGPDPAITGLADAGPTPTGNDVVIGQKLAKMLGIGVGDPIELFASGSSKQFKVRNVVEEIGLAGYAPIRSSFLSTTAPSTIFVPKGTIDAFTAGSTVKAAAPPTFDLLVSNDGGVFDGSEASARIADELTARLKDVPGAQVNEVKFDLLDRAKSQGESISALYQGIGFFSVIAGILLLVNLFVMLSEERKSELGMLRAQGFKRNHLVRTFAIEGSVYSVVASVLGAFAGLGVGFVIMKVTSGIFNRGDANATFPLVVKPASLLAGGVFGLVISMFTVWGTSFRIARLNIIRAIRDLPEPPHTKRSPWSLVLASLLVLVGAGLFAAGWNSSNAVTILAGPAIAAFSAIFVLDRVLPRKPVTVVSSIAVLVWGVGAFTFAGSRMGRPGINVFVVQGVVLVSAAVLLLAQADRVWAKLADLLAATGRGLAGRLGLAYPLARKFRTSLLLAMYSIVIFTMTFISVLSGIFGNQVPEFTDNVRSGFDLFVDSNQGNPVTIDQLKAVPGVASVAPLTRGIANAVTPKRPDGANVPISGFDQSLLDQGQPKLESRGAGYASDADAFRAVLADPSLIVVSNSFGSRNQGGGPPQANLVVGDKVTLKNTGTGTAKDLTVAGIMASDFVGNGALTSTVFVTDLLASRVVANRHYLKVSPGADPDQVASSVSGALIQNGASARSFRSVVAELLENQQSFFGVLRGYLGLGLLIGIAGLGVVMVRAVRERRREIGMLRAMGFSAAIVRRAFLLEAGFVALQGILIGMILGMVTAYNLLVNSDSFGSQKLDFSWPWSVLAVIAVVPLLASLLATAAPATQAARIRPAAALRIAD